jgi:Fur family ferric uptake transcriptional regulator
MATPGEAGQWRAAGLAPTARRRSVLAVLEGRDRPVSAIEIYQELRERGDPIGLTTVYRTLHALVDAGLAHAFPRGGELTYRHCHDYPHHHLVCNVCGLVIERPAEAVARWLEQVYIEADFQPDPGHSDLRGVCGPCARAGQ